MGKQEAKASSMDNENNMFGPFLDRGFKPVPDGAIEMWFCCMNEDCEKEHGDDPSREGVMEPQDIEFVGQPICGCCDRELSYMRTFIKSE